MHVKRLARGSSSSNNMTNNHLACAEAIGAESLLSTYVIALFGIPTRALSRTTEINEQ